MKTWILALVLSGQMANAATGSMAAFNCPDLRKASQKLQVHADNIANRLTTKTADGSPYRRVDIVCRELYCETIAREDFKLVQEPSHPDANISGYVRYPRIDVASEYAALQAAAAEVRLLAANKTCGASALTDAQVALIKYDPGSSIQTDTFNMSSDGRLVSWSRTQRDGTSKHVAFNQDGTINKQ